MQVKTIGLVFVAALLVWSVYCPIDAVGQATELGDGLTVVYGKPIAPALDLKGTDGKRYRLSDYQGRVVLINFWATWCPPCIQELPTLQRLKELLADQPFEILAVNLGEDEGAVQAFRDKFKIKMDFPILMARDESIIEQWKIQGVPISYVVDGSGRRVYEALGPRNFASLHIIERIRSLMAE